MLDTKKNNAPGQSMDSMAIDLRPVTGADRGAWSRLWSDYLSFYGTSLPSEAYDAAFAQLLSDDPNSFRGILAWRGAEAVGVVHWLPHAHMWRPEGTTYLQDLYVAPQARGAGLGRRLIEAVYADADARGAPRVYWLTQEGNATARALYDRVARVTDFLKYDRVLP